MTHGRRGHQLLRQSALLAGQLHRQRQSLLPGTELLTSTSAAAPASFSARCFSCAPVWSSACPQGPPAFVFDIDGVLIRGRHVLPEALQAVKKLSTPQGTWRYPVVFMTNGGGVTEVHKAEQLTEWLGLRVAPSQVILAHSPMRELVPDLTNRPVLVAGRGEVMEVAAEYGFRRLLHTRQLGAAMPAATPFTTYPKVGDKTGTQTQTHPQPSVPQWESRYQPSQTQPSVSEGGVGAGGRGGEEGGGEGVGGRVGGCPVRDLGYGTEAAPIDTVLVMTDPDDWYRDAQLICDVLTGAGVVTRTAAAAAAAGAPPVKLVFSNPDLLWANEFPKNRFGQGAFAHMVLTLYGRLTGGARPHHVTFYGKPNPQPYRLAERLLLAQAQSLGLPLPPTPPGAPPFSAIFAVGDNPAADVRGANSAGSPWVSVLVRTGVFQGPGNNCDVDTARVAVDDVAAAVEAGLHAARSMRWHAMR